MKKTILFLLMAVALTTQTLFAQVPSYVPTNGLMAYYPFNGNANDESGNGNNGTVNGATLTTDRFGSINNSYQFIENTDMISITNTTINPQDFTISGWCKLNSPFVYTTFSILEIANLDYTTPGGIGLHMTQNDGIFGNGNYKVYGFSSNNAQVDSAILSYNFVSNWNHFVVVKHNGTIQLFINSLLIATSPATQITDFTNSWLQIGSRQNINNNPLSSRNIDDIGIWNRALTQQEITNLYNSSLPQTACLPANVPTTGLVGYWPFCGNANDESGNGNNGTNNGATLTADRFGNTNSAYSFDGLDDFITVNNNPNILYPEFTVTIWFNSSTSFCQANGPIIRSGNASTCSWNGFSIGTFNNDNNFGLQNYDGSDYSFQSNQLCSNFNSGTWYNITFTRSNSESREYVNGILVSSVLQSNYQPATQCPIFFGSNHLDSNNNPLSVFNGKVDDIGIWNRVLTQEEITNLYNVNQCITNITVTDTLVINVGQLSFNDPVTWANNITIAPNPASSQININFNNITNLNGGTLKIINSLGQEVATTPITTSGTNSTMQLATWGGTGMYFVQIINPQGQIVDIKKIILQ